MNLRFHGMATLSGNLRLSSLAALAVASFAAASPALAASDTAQGSEATADASGSSEKLNEIIVTSEHVETDVQKLTSAVSVYGGDALRKANITDMSALSAVSPNVNFAITEGKSIVTIRGISSRDTSENGDPAVTVNTDGFYLNRPYSLNATMYDLDRVEVLRGPQGTLNGRNSVGGAINIITAKPTDSFGGYGSIAYGNYNALQIQGAVNIPMADWLQVRASFFSDDHDGYRNNAPAGRGDDADNKSGRLQIAFQPASNLRGLIAMEYTRMKGMGDAMNFVPFVYDDSGSLVHDRPAGIDGKTFAIYTKPYLRSTEKQIRGNLVYDAGGIEITALGGYDVTRWHHAVDQTLASDVEDGYQFQENQYPKTINAELRVASQGNGPFKWQAGAFYFHEKSNLHSANAYPEVSGFTEGFGFEYATKTRSEAVYAQASYELTPQLKVTGGLRYTHDYKDENGYYGDLGEGVVYAYQQGSSSSSKTTFHAVVDYELTPENLVYAKFDTGYKAGGFNIGGSSYRPESLKAYEIGSKNRFLNDQLQLNLSAFYNDYTDQQVSNYAYLDTGDAVQLTQNAGASRIWGLESELLYKVPVLGTVNLSVNYLHARYTDFLSVADPNDPNASGNVQLKGNRPPQSPTWSIAGGLKHDWNVPGGTLTAQAQSKFQSATNFSAYNFADTRQGAYTMSDAMLTYQAVDSDWSITAYVKNIEDHEILRDAEESAYAVAYAYTFYPPRTYGLRLQYNW